MHASAVRVGHLARAGPPRAARALLVESRLRGGEEGDEQGYLHFVECLQVIVRASTKFTLQRRDRQTEREEKRSGSVR